MLRVGSSMIVERRWARLCLAASALTLAACASSQTYAGVPLTAGAAEPQVQDLARRARSGDKPAQLELGVRYEEGRGLPVDLGCARSLYTAAATRSATLWTHVPGAGGGRSMMVPVQLSRSSGLEEARIRLDRLESAAPNAAGRPKGATRCSHGLKLRSL